MTLNGSQKCKGQLELLKEGMGTNTLISREAAVGDRTRREDFIGFSGSLG